ncbi:hypothetical protein SEA_SOYO_18 [Mycobacterium phage SoYo]|uniref:Head-to-tail connector complex protein n=34 Tax=Microwolfvirus TaxID=2942894 RepID=A0A345L1C6_9CAUD|nr:head-tail connector protein [Mycobacterium phage Bxz2]YP_009195116.1 head-tail connector protein [Mycobacterium phage Tiffany]YP_009198443.1 head-tail connector protein [Mycobacterium phage MarQuardt]YP_009219079.1 head-tail connector protein [Mycobacterium phage Anubis]YP_009635608.1 head-tail connector protein [Mycobacterium phage JHC117]YP_009635693.1 head-tail connector protein [Mycobacterium phage Microwolf]AEK07680.1 hypothetical protein VIX_18 [Mycobacterium phage Vix]AGK87219.1 hy
MKIRHRANGGFATVDDETAEKLIALGIWERADAPKPASPKRSPRRRQRAAQKPAEAPNNEE